MSLVCIYSDSTCLNGLFSESRRKVTVKSKKKKCDEIPGRIELHFVYEDETLLCQKKLL